MSQSYLRSVGAGLAVLFLGALPAAAEITAVNFKTTRNVGFFWGTSISNVLRSQDGVDDVENPYPNLQKGLVRVLPKKDVAIDLPEVLQVLEKKVGFEPITQVTLEMKGYLDKRRGTTIFQVSGTGQGFRVRGNKMKGTAPPQGDLITVVAGLKTPKSPDAIVLYEWKRAEGPRSSK